MGKNINHIQHLKSSVVVENGGIVSPKLPTPESFVDGEIAVNYADGYETLSIKSSSGNIATFSSDDYYSEKKLGSAFTGENSAITVTKCIEDNEKVISSALNNLEERKLNASAMTDYYTKSETSGKTEISNALGGKVNTATFTAHTSDTSIHHTHSNKTYLDGITGTVGTMAYENVSSYSSATQVNTALSGKSDTGHTHDDRYYTEAEIDTLVGSGFTSSSSITDVIIENERITSSALNDLNMNKLDASALTDNKVEQLNITADGSYEVLLAGSTATATTTEGSSKNVGITYNPSTSALTVSKKVATTALNQLIIGTGTTGTTGTVETATYCYPAKWTYNKGTVPTDGDIYTIKIPVAGHSYGVYISLNNGTNYYPVVLNGNGALTTQYPVNTDISVVFESGSTAANIYPVTGATSGSTGTSAAGVFRVINYYDSNTKYSVVDNTYLRYCKYKAANVIYRYQLLVQKDETSLLPLNTVSSSIATTKTLTTEEFDPFGNILYYNVTSTTDANTIIPTGCTYQQILMDLRYATNVGKTLTANKSVYLVAEPQSNGKAKLASTAISQTLPTTDDGKIYIYLGIAYNTYNVDLAINHPIYQFKNGQLRQYVGTFGTMAYENASSYSSATQVNTALGDKVDKTEYATFSAATNTSISDLSGQSETVAAALVDLDSRTSANANALNALDEKFLKEITYAELVTLRNNGELEPGAKYRITDYVTTTAQANTQSAGHQFDIIVTADANNKLNEDAHAAIHSGDTYFSASTLDAWELKYSLENDTDRFQWADDTNGKGVIWWMKDEWNNECWYDFKNIMFKRYKITASTVDGLIGLYSIEGATNITADTSTTYYCYTFTMIDTSDNMPHDVSVEQDVYYGDEGYCYKTKSNIFKPFYDANYDLDPIPYLMILPNNVFVTDTDICAIEGTYGEFYGFYDNTFGNSCESNTFGNYCRYNTFGNSCESNTFGNDNYSNTFGNECYYNTFGNNNYSNTFGNYCRYNTFGNDNHSNTFGNNNYRNTFGNSCSNNTFGNSCGSNTFGNECYYNTFGNDNYSNTFGNNNYSNTFGNECYYNTFGNYCWYNTFGNNCNQIKFQKDYIYYCIIENGNQYIGITSTQTTSSSNVIRNFTVSQGVNNSTTVKTISHNTVNDTFKTTYQNSSSTVVNI